MAGYVTVMSPVTTSSAQRRHPRGSMVFPQAPRCTKTGLHHLPRNRKGPAVCGPLRQAGQTQRRDDGDSDEAYIRESVLYPSGKIVADISPIMPTYKGQVSEEQLCSLWAYISL